MEVKKLVASSWVNDFSFLEESLADFSLKGSYFSILLSLLSGLSSSFSTKLIISLGLLTCALFCCKSLVSELHSSFMSLGMSENTFIKDFFTNVIHSLQITDLSFSLLLDPWHNIA
jgi:hypothetical protein